MARTVRDYIQIMCCAKHFVYTSNLFQRMDMRKNLGNYIYEGDVQYKPLEQLSSITTAIHSLSNSVWNVTVGEIQTMKHAYFYV